MGGGEEINLCGGILILAVNIEHFDNSKENFICESERVLKIIFI